MFFSRNKVIAYLLIIFVAINNKLIAGPPFNTDDPEPVEYRHWEFYILSIHTIQPNLFSGTFPHFETNYGVIPNMQLHLLLPFNYNYNPQQHFSYGYENTEFGIKYRFVKESEAMPQIGVFPIIEIPTISNSNFGNNKPQVYLPLWLQKSWNKLASYGGLGYWINPGAQNRNWIFTGWEFQYDFSKTLTLGGEIFYHSSDTNEANNFLGFNFGGFLNFSEKFHILFSFGHNIITPGNEFISYLGVQWTI